MPSYRPATNPKPPRPASRRAAAWSNGKPCAASPITVRKRNDFFVKFLRALDPPNWNQVPVQAGTGGVDPLDEMAMPWVKGAPSQGFGPGATPWLPQPDSYADLAVDQHGAHGAVGGMEDERP